LLQRSTLARISAACAGRGAAGSDFDHVKKFSSERGNPFYSFAMQHISRVPLLGRFLPELGRVFGRGHFFG
jgi:hypothetical protein